MPTGLSLHMGIDYLSTSAYPGINPLPNCPNDALAMQEIARQFGYNSCLLINEQADYRNMKERILWAASQLTSRDIFFLSFSGHGSQKKDLSGEEEDGWDETLLLNDRELIDDELFELWVRFKPGVRIIVVLDSCHSGTAVKEGDYVNEQGFRRSRFPVQKDGDIAASGLLLSACQDHQRAFSGIERGLQYSLFTHCILNLQPIFRDLTSYNDLHRRISARMPGNSRPNLYPFGPGGAQLAKTKPFRI